MRTLDTLGVVRERDASYLPALDGLRALAVAAVLAYHAGVAGVPGGFLGVDVFFVLSGYLITTLVVAEWRRTGGVALGAFWDRRFRRLAPALTVVVAVVVARAAVIGTTGGVRGDAVATLGWAQNWHLALGKTSYFAVFGEASPLRHAWSLALEAQWYLAWPVVLLVGLRLTRGRERLLGGVALALAGASALLMAAMFDPGSDPSRVYYGTDTRAQTLLVGAGLALVTRGRPTSRWWGLAGVAGAAVLAHAVTARADLDPGLYRGGFLVVALAAAALLGAACRGRWGSGVLGAAPLAALGRISYGIYLWHWPLYLWLGPSWSTVGLVVGLAAASARLIEVPVRRARPERRRVAFGVAVASAGMVAATTLVLPLTSVPRPVYDGLLSTDTPSAPPSTQPPAPGAELEPVERVLVAGDSVAWTLAENFDPAWVGDAFSLDFRASYLGCGVASGQPLNEGRPILWADPACEHWQDRWRDGLESFRPDVVVVLLGAWEVLDHRVDGEVRRAGSADAEAWLRSEIERGMEMIISAGARPVLLTAPCYRPEGEAPDRSTSDRGDDARVAWFNGVLAEAAADHQGALLVDLHGMLCPDGAYAEEIAGVEARTDGVHLTTAAARRVWAWLAPQVAPN